MILDVNRGRNHGAKCQVDYAVIVRGIMPYSERTHWRVLTIFTHIIRCYSLTLLKIILDGQFLGGIIILTLIIPDSRSDRNGQRRQEPILAPRRRLE